MKKAITKVITGVSLIGVMLLNTLSTSAFAMSEIRTENESIIVYETDYIPTEEGHLYTKEELKALNPKAFENSASLVKNSGCILEAYCLVPAYVGSLSMAVITMSGAAPVCSLTTEMVGMYGDYFLYKASTDEFEDQLLGEGVYGIVVNGNADVLYVNANTNFNFVGKMFFDTNPYTYLPEISDSQEYGYCSRPAMQGTHRGVFGVNDRYERFFGFFGDTSIANEFVYHPANLEALYEEVFTYFANPEVRMMDEYRSEFFMWADQGSYRDYVTLWSKYYDFDEYLEITRNRILSGLRNSGTGMYLDFAEPDTYSNTNCLNKDFGWDITFEITSDFPKVDIKTPYQYPDLEHRAKVIRIEGDENTPVKYSGGIVSIPSMNVVSDATLSNTPIVDLTPYGYIAPDPKPGVDGTMPSITPAPVIEEKTDIAIPTKTYIEKPTVTLLPMVTPKNSSNYSLPFIIGGVIVVFFTIIIIFKKKR